MKAKRSRDRKTIPPHHLRPYSPGHLEYDANHPIQVSSPGFFIETVPGEREQLLEGMMVRKTVKDQAMSAHYLSDTRGSNLS